MAHLATYKMLIRHEACHNLVDFNANNAKAHKIQFKNNLHIISSDLVVNEYILKGNKICDSLASIGVSVDHYLTR